MFSFLVNGLLIAIGGTIGLLLHKVIKKELCDQVLKAVGAVVIIFGIAGVLRYMLKVEIVDGVSTISTTNDLMLIITIALGTFLGEIIKIDHHLETFGNYLEKKLNKGSFSEGFVNATIIFCVGAMAIVGSVSSALGDASVTYLKSTIDAITAMVLASTLGFGVIFSAIPVIVYQGSLTLLAYLLGDFMSDKFISGFSMVGYAIVMCIGINFIMKDNKIKVANMLPSLILVIIYFLFF